MAHYFPQIIPPIIPSYHPHPLYLITPLLYDPSAPTHVNFVVQLKGPDLTGFQGLDFLSGFPNVDFRVWISYLDVLFTRFIIFPIHLIYFISYSSYSYYFLVILFIPFPIHPIYPMSHSSYLSYFLSLVNRG